jgi:hypothetical protein
MARRSGDFGDAIRRPDLGRRIARSRLPILLLVLVVGSCGRSSDGAGHRLAAIAVLPADTFTAGPTSGQFIDAAHGVTPPFWHRQPIQGFSGMITDRQEGFTVVCDNGFGAKSNSADFVLRVVHVVPRFRTAQGGDGTVAIRSSFVLHDPDARIGFAVVADLEGYPNGDGSIPVDSVLVRERWLTGADLDLESIRRMPDGTFWFGDEFGPFLVHTDATGRVLGPAVPLPDVAAPENPLRGATEPNARSSGGFEGMALAVDGSRLYPMLEKPLVDDPADLLGIYEFDPGRGAYTQPRPVRRYRLSTAGNEATAFTAITDRKFLVLERDDEQGNAARFKRVFLVDFDVVNEDGGLAKRLLVDLLRIPDPDGLGGQGAYFSFPFITPESLVVVDDRTLGIVNDNNYPFSVGRHLDTGRPDDDEFLLVRFDTPLADLEVASAAGP